MNEKQLRKWRKRERLLMLVARALALVAAGVSICGVIAFACNTGESQTLAGIDESGNVAETETSSSVKITLAGVDVDGIVVSTEEEEEILVSKDETTTEVEVSYDIVDLSLVGYATESLNVRSGPGTEYEIVGYFCKGNEIVITGECQELGWYRITYNDVDAYVSKEYVTETAFKTYNGIAEGDTISGEATYYCSCEICCGKSDGITASGVTVHDGIVACNWLPLGTQILIDGVEYTVADHGSSNFDTVGRLDVYTSRGHQAALDMGRDDVTITIVYLP